MSSVAFFAASSTLGVATTFSGSVTSGRYFWFWCSLLMISVKFWPSICMVLAITFFFFGRRARTFSW